MLQTMRRSHCHFCTSDARAENGHLRWAGLLAKPFPYAREIIERLGGYGVFGETLKLGHARGDTDINRADIITNWCTIRHDHLLFRSVNMRCLAQNNPRTCRAGDADEVNVEFVGGVVSGHKAGKHAAIRRARCWIDDRQARAGKRLHRPHFQNECVGVTAANQDEVAGQGKCSIHERLLHPRREQGQHTERHSLARVYVTRILSFRDTLCPRGTLRW